MNGLASGNKVSKDGAWGIRSLKSAPENKVSKVFKVFKVSKVGRCRTRTNIGFK